MNFRCSVLLAMSLSASVSGVAAAGGARAAPEPSSPDMPALKVMAQKDCAELNVELARQVELNNYAKPDGGNALLIMAAQSLKGCSNSSDSTPAVTAREGIKTTIAYLDDLDRMLEVCAIADVMESVPSLSDIQPKFGGRRMPFCRNPATTKWTEADTRVVAARTERAIRISIAVGKMRVAIRDQRIYSPAGNNAIEYALEGRAANDPREGVEFESALLDFLPYAIIAAEHASKHHDQVELARLVELITRVDPQAPALARLRKLMEKI